MPTDASGPNIETLRTFALFAEHGEVKLTAKSLGLSDSVVSRRLQELAASPYGLLGKRGHGLVLTEKGHAVFPSVARMLRAYDQLIGRLANRDAAAEVLRIAAGGGLGETPFPGALAAFRLKRPEVGVRVHGCRGRDRIRGVARGEFDLALVSHDEAQARAIAGEAIRVRTLREQTMRVAVARQSPDGKRLEAWPEDKPVSPALLAELTLLGLDPQSGVRRQLDRALAAAGVPALPRVMVFPGGWSSALACARLGLGVAIVPTELATDPEPDLVVRPFLGGFSMADRVVTLADVQDDRIEDLVGCLEAAFASRTRP